MVMIVFIPLGPLDDTMVVLEAKAELEGGVVLLVVKTEADGLEIKVGAADTLAASKLDVLAGLSEVTFDDRLGRGALGRDGSRAD